MKLKFKKCAVGDRYGKLVVLELLPIPKNPRAVCLCDCGQTVTRQRGALVRGKAVSCGCTADETSSVRKLIDAISVQTDACILSPMKASVNGGYGFLRFNGHNERAHRVAYAHANKLTLRDIAHLDIRHKCDNPPCVNPRHLESGTHADNMRDMFSRGRRTAAAGEKAANVKITERQAMEIKKRCAAGESDALVAKDYPISTGQIRQIRLGKSWRHLP